jgi:hypothetical protein
MRRINFLILMVGMFLSFSLGAMEDEKAEALLAIGMLLRGVITVGNEPTGIEITDPLLQKWKNFGINHERYKVGDRLCVLPVKEFTYHGPGVNSDWLMRAPCFVAGRFTDVNGDLKFNKQYLPNKNPAQDALLFPSYIPNDCVVTPSNSTSRFINFRLPGCEEVSIPMPST